MVPLNNKETALLTVYNASYGGKHELAGEIQDREIQVEQGWITYSECRKDPLSTHQASSCRVTLTRMTEAGVNKAKELAKNKEEDAVEFLYNLEKQPPRIQHVYRYLMKKWLKACQNRENYDWRIQLKAGSNQPQLPLPETIKKTISTLNTSLVDNGLASYASLSHKTSGPSPPTLVTCPEIKELIYHGRSWKEPYVRGVQHSELDEYLKYLLNGLCLAQAKNHLLFFFDANRYSISEHTIEWLYNEYGASRDSLMSFLEELENSDYIHILNGMKRRETDILATGNPLNYFADGDKDIQDIKKQVSENVQRWFETGEESFQRFELTRRVLHK